MQAADPPETTVKISPPADSDKDKMLDAPNTFSASAGAHETGKKVEDLSQRTESVQVVANPNGTFTRRDFGDAVRIKRSGEWVDVDYDLTKRSDGSWVPKASPVDVVIDGGSAKEAGRVTFTDGKSLAVTWPTALPEPTVQGGVATYKVSDTSDLLLSVTSAGVNARLRLNEAPADGDPVVSFGLRSENVEVNETDGGLAIVDDNGKKLGGTSNLVAWDARVDDAGDPAEIIPLDVNLEPGTSTGDVSHDSLELTTPEGFLDDPATQYPVTIDPDIAGMAIARDTWVRSGGTENGNEPALWIGKVNGDSNTNPGRAFVQFDTSPLVGKQIVSAQLSFWQYYAYTCSDRQMNIHAADQSWATNMVWAGRPGGIEGTGVYVGRNNLGGPGCTNGPIGADVTNIVRNWTAGFYANNGFRIMASNETQSSYSRRFCSGNPSSAHAICNNNGGKPQLVITYNTAPATPWTPTATVVGSQATVKSTVFDRDSGSARARFIVWKDDNPILDLYSDFVTSGSTATKVLPNLADGTYSVQAWGNDGSLESGRPSPLRTFVIDTASAPFEGTIEPIRTARLVDTKSGLGGSTSAFGTNEVRTYQVTGQGGIPNVGAKAVIADVATSETAAVAGAIEVTSAGGSAGSNPSLLTSSSDPSRSGFVISKLSSDGKISVKNTGVATHLNLDVHGYVSSFSASSAGRFVPVQGAIAADTVAGTGLPAGAVSTGGMRTVDLSVGDLVPADAKAVFAKVSVNASAGPAGSVLLSDDPLASSEAQRGSTVDYGLYPSSSLALINLDAARKFKILNSASGSPLDLKIEIVGYISNNARVGGTYSAVEPAELYSTGTASQTVLAAGETRVVQATGLAGLPDTGTVASIHATVLATGWSEAGGLIVSNPDVDQANSPALTFGGGDSPTAGRSTQVFVPPSIDGKILLRNTSSGPLAVRLVAQGWTAVKVVDPNAGPEPAAEVGESDSSLVQQMLDLQPGATENEVLEGISDAAFESGLPESDIAAAQLSELKLSVAQNKLADVGAGDDEEMGDPADPGTTAGSIIIQGNPSNKGKEYYRLVRSARRAGDVLYSPASSFGYTHGHSAIFSGKYTLVEAPGGGKRAREVDFRKKVFNLWNGARLQEVRVGGNLLSSRKRHDAVYWARSRAGDGDNTGDKYNGNIFRNTKIVSGPVGSEGSKQNCSQLVWAAFKKEAGVDFNTVEKFRPDVMKADSDFVFPAEIRDSQFTRTYDRIDNAADAANGN